MPVKEETSTKGAESEFAKKIWIAGGIVALIAIIIFLLKATFNVLLLILAGILIALFFRGLSSLIQRKTKWKEGVSLAVSVIFTLLLIIALVWLVGYKIQTQISELSDTLPKTVENAKAQISKNPLGEKLITRLSSPQAAQQSQGMGSKFFKTTFGVFGDLYVVFFLGIFFTVSPKLYTEGMVKLVPKKGQKRAAEILDNIGDNLTKWLKGQLFAMFVVFVLTAIGLSIMGIPMWLVLALIAGLLNFIPNFGPLIAMIPAILVALMQSPKDALIVAGLYVFIQVLESNFITPMVQKKLINIPPALIIIAQMFMGALTGGWGLVLSIPLMVVLMITVQELYTKKNNEE